MSNSDNPFTDVIRSAMFKAYDDGIKMGWLRGFMWGTIAGILILIGVGITLLEMEDLKLTLVRGSTGELIDKGLCK